MIYKSYLLEESLNPISKNNFILFYGENLGLKDDFKNKIKSYSKNAEIVNLLQDDIIKNEESFFSKFFNYSLFDKEKVFIINNINDKILPVVEKIAERKDEQKIYLFSGILDKKSKIRNYLEKSPLAGVVPCYADNAININKIIKNKLKNFKNLTTQNINIIVESCNLDRIKLYNELDKITLYFVNKDIQTDKLRSLLNDQENDDFNFLKNEALSGNKLMTNKLISSTALEKEKNFMYLSLISQRLLKLNEIYYLKDNTNLESAINNLKPAVFWKDKPIFLNQAKKWNIKKIKKTLSKVYNLELTMKSNSVVNTNMLIKGLLLDLCIIANS